MKACPKCREENEESNRFCKKCGLELSDSSFQHKKEKVLGEKKGRPSWSIVLLIVVAIALGGVAYWLIQGNSGASPKVSSQPKVSGKVDYSGQTVRMTDVVAKVENGKIIIPVHEVKEKKIVRFEYEGKGLKIPLLAYLTMAGRVVTAISMCEPCKSTRFHIKDKSMVCNACYTEWNLETLKGISGGCMNYPPEVIPNTLEKDSIVIDEKVVINWKPRV
ncbi:MAG: Fe-S-containing protein [Thermodesulfobacteriota bacterium]|nr:Fe-S-containing protein [Thermodesulfobacteriota bacterium]